MSFKKLSLWATLSLAICVQAFALGQANDPSGEEVIEKYLEALGGKEKLQAIQSAKVELSSEVQGMVLDMFFTYDDANERMNQRVMVMGNEASNITFKDGQVEVTGMGQQQFLEDEQYQEARMNMFIFPELHFGREGYELSNEGTESVNGEETYKVVVKNANGATVTNYYSVENGLKVKTETETAGETIYSDYEEFDGVKYPTLLTVKSPMLPGTFQTKVEKVEFNAEVSDDDFE